MTITEVTRLGDPEGGVTEPTSSIEKKVAESNRRHKANAKQAKRTARRSSKRGRGLPLTQAEPAARYRYYPKPVARVSGRHGDRLPGLLPFEKP
jgi:hypothetical protein